MSKDTPTDNLRLRTTKNSFVHPSYIFHCLRWTAQNWGDEALTKAVRLHHVGLMLPNVTFRVILDIVEGKRVVTVEEPDGEYDYLCISEVITEEE
jgi:hypothetical protein